MGSIGDPVKVGVVPNLAHPGGNVTGFSSQSFELEEKRFGLLRDLVPGMTRLVMLGNIGNLYVDLAMTRLEAPPGSDPGGKMARSAARDRAA